jgi:hypothetical protein
VARKGLSASLRWSVFARDGFSCRYCGRQAGEDGVELEADHVVSLADGGSDGIDNLVTSCRVCNGGKGARSLQDLPPEAASAIHERIAENRKKIAKVARGIRASIAARKDSEQSIVNIKCHAYKVKSTRFDAWEMQQILKLVEEFGPDKVVEWYAAAASAGVPELKAIRYICGCARNCREEEAA